MKNIAANEYEVLRRVSDLDIEGFRRTTPDKAAISSIDGLHPYDVTTILDRQALLKLQTLQNL